MVVNPDPSLKGGIIDVANAARLLEFAYAQGWQHTTFPKVAINNIEITQAPATREIYLSFKAPKNIAPEDMTIHYSLPGGQDYAIAVEAGSGKNSTQLRAFRDNREPNGNIVNEGTLRYSTIDHSEAQEYRIIIRGEKTMPNNVKVEITARGPERQSPLAAITPHNVHRHIHDSMPLHNTFLDHLRETAERFGKIVKRIDRQDVRPKEMDVAGKTMPGQISPEGTVWLQTAALILLLLNGGSLAVRALHVKNDEQRKR